MSVRGAFAKLPRKRVLIPIAAVSVIAVLIVVAIVVALRARRVEADLTLPDGTAVRVAAPASAGKVTITPTDPLQKKQVPLATLPVGSPVQITGKSSDTGHDVVFSYEKLTIPAGLKPEEDLTIITRDDSSQTWTPVGGEVDTAKRTISVTTTHFSQWGMAITDPQELQRRQAFADHLDKSPASGKVIEMLYGKPGKLNCNPQNPLLPAKIEGETQVGSSMCQEYLGNGKYRLAFLNGPTLPRRFRLPAGFTEVNPSRRLSQQDMRALSGNDAQLAFVAANGLMEVAFDGSAVKPDTRIEGNVDWTGAGAAVLLDLSAMVVGDTKAEPIATSTEMWDCIADAEKNQGSATAGTQDEGKRIVDEIVKQCQETVASQTAKYVAEKKGVKLLAKKVAKWFSKRLDVISKSTVLMDIFRMEMDALLIKSMRVDTHLNIVPARLSEAKEKEADLQRQALEWKPFAVAQLKCSDMTLKTETPKVWPGGDLTDDGKPEHIISGRCEAITSSHSFHVWIVDGTTGPTNAKLLGKVGGDLQTDFKIIKGLEVRGKNEEPDGKSKLRISAFSRSEKTPLCCTDQNLVVTAQWNGSAVTENGREVIPFNRDLTSSVSPFSAPMKSFSSPLGNIGCMMTDEKVQCTVAERTWSPPPKPANAGAVCEWGHGLHLTSEGASFGCDDSMMTGPKTQYGKWITFGAYSCVVTAEGATPQHKTAESVKCRVLGSNKGLRLSGLSYDQNHRS